MNKRCTSRSPTGVVELSAAEIEALQAQLRRDIAELDMLLDEPIPGEFSGEFREDS